MPDIEQLIHEVGGPLPTEAPEAQIMRRARLRRTRRHVAQVALSLAVLAGGSALAVSQLSRPSVEFGPADNQRGERVSGPAACGYSSQACMGYDEKRRAKPPISVLHPDAWKMTVMHGGGSTSWTASTGPAGRVDLTDEPVEPGYTPDVCMIPTDPLQAVEGDGALVTVQSMGRTQRFAPRPDSLSLEDGRPYGRPPFETHCSPPPEVTITGFRFRDRGRDFQAFVALGTRASDRTREIAVAVLNNFEVRGQR